jgi:hypothetical protein
MRWSKLDPKLTPHVTVLAGTSVLWTCPQASASSLRIIVVATSTATQRVTATMYFSKSLLSAALLLTAGIAEAASSWSFDEGTVTVVSKKAGDGLKEK